MKHETVLPKNIRQIGEIQQDKKVYLEDYVMTFIRKREKDAQEKDCAGILLGTKEQGEAGVFMFVKGAVHLEEEEEQEQKRQSYFPELEVLGYYVIGTMEEEKLEKLMDPPAASPFVIFHIQEGEENVYWSEEKQFQRLGGYFIFYERNPQMQKYMSECTEPQKVEEEEGSSDQAIINFREKVKEKHSMSRRGGMRYLAGSFLTLTILMLGVTIINNYDKMKDMEETISRISVEQERERLQIATANAEAERAAPSENVQTDSDASAAPAENDMSDDDVAMVSSGNTQISTEDDLPDGSETSENIQASEDEDALAAALSQLSEGSETAAANSDAVLPEAGATQSARALAERNYSAETAEPLDQSTFGKTDEIVASAQRQSQSAYTVRYGDTLADISQRYYGSLDMVEAICALNEIDDANMIVPGQKIVLP